MSTIHKISLLETIALVLIVSVNRIILYLPQNSLITSGSAATLNVIYISAIAIILTLIVLRLYKNFVGLDIFDISDFLGGKVLKNIVCTIVTIYIVFISAILIREFSEVIHILYYRNASIVYILLSFIIVAAISNFISENSVIKTNFFFTIVMIASLILCFVFAFPNMTYQRFFPILGNGVNSIFGTGLINVFSFNGLIILYLIPTMMKDPEYKELKKVYIVSVVITTVLLILATVCLLLSFSFITNIENISPLYLLISNNQFVEYFQHPESLFILAWILSFISYLNIAIMFAIRILKKMTNVRNSRPFIIPVCIVTFICSLIPESLMAARNMNTFISKYVAGPFVFILFPLLIAFANIKKKRRAK